jgi:hypothetical protein
MILLGAGASKVFGLPTLQDLTTNLIELFENKGNTDLVNEIIEALTQFGIKPDFENIYSTIEALANPRDYIGKSNGVIAYFAHKANLDKATNNPDIANILSEMRSLVYKKCTLSKFTPNHQKIFDKLMKVCAHGELRHLSPIIGGNGEERILDSGIQTIVTTNYDTIVELYHNFKRIKLATGFKKEEGETNIWAPLDLTEYGRKPKSNWLIKLHGSIWQFKRYSGEIIQTVGEPANFNLDFTIKENLMIYPIGQKPILEHPYF